MGISLPDAEQPAPASTTLAGDFIKATDEGGVGYLRDGVNYVNAGSQPGAADLITGGGAAETLLGLGGNDALLGGVGDDLIDGGDGNDVLMGGLGRWATYRSFASLQMAAEATRLDEVLSGSISLTEALTFGNNRSSRFSDVQAEQFAHVLGW